MNFVTLTKIIKRIIINNKIDTITKIIILYLIFLSSYVHVKKNNTFI